MTNPYIESLFFDLVSRRSQAMANFHFASASKPTASEAEFMQDKLQSYLSQIVEVNSQIDILTKLFPDLNKLIPETSDPTSEQEEGVKESPSKENFSPKGSSIYEDGELVRKPES